MQTVELRNYFILAKSSNTIGPKTQIIDDAPFRVSITKRRQLEGEERRRKVTRPSNEIRFFCSSGSSLV